MADSYGMKVRKYLRQWLGNHGRRRYEQEARATATRSDLLRAHGGAAGSADAEKARAAAAALPAVDSAPPTLDIYSPQEREQLGELLLAAATESQREVLEADLKAVLDEIEGLVALYVHTREILRKYPASDRAKDLLNDAEPLVKGLLEIVNDTSLWFLRDDLRSLRHGLTLLLGIIDNSRPRKPGRPGDTYARELVERLLDIWNEATGATPTFSMNDARVGAAHAFLRTALQEASSAFSDEVLRNRIRAYRRHRDSAPPDNTPR